VTSIPKFLSVAQEQLQAGIKSKNTPDSRVLLRNGINTSEADAKYFEETLPKLAEGGASCGQKDQLGSQLGDSSQKAAWAIRGLRDFIATTFFDDVTTTKVKPEFGGDKFAMGEEEYNWALKNNFRVDKTAAQLYEESWPIVEATQKQMVDLAREIGKSHNLSLPSDGPAAVRAVFD